MAAGAGPAAALKVGVLAGCLCLSTTAPALAADPARINLDQLPQTWRDDEARDWGFRRIEGRPVVVTMGYTTCHRICPMVIEEFRRLERAADSRGEPLEFVVVGYDPKNDGPASWHRYRANRGLTRANWHFVTGTPVEVEQLARQLGFPFWTMDDHVMHESRAVLFDSHGRERVALSPPLSAWPGLVHLSICSEAKCSGNF